jgi:hypothetical protein
VASMRTSERGTKSSDPSMSQKGSTTRKFNPQWLRQPPNDGAPGIRSSLSAARRLKLACSTYGAIRSSSSEEA